MATIGTIFSSVAASYRDHVAVEGALSSWTYGELDAKSASVAAHLTARGVGAGDRVALIAGRSPEFIAAILGIIRVGAVYAPIDTASPPARQAALIDSLRPRALLVDAAARTDALGDICATLVPIPLAIALRESPGATAWAALNSDHPLYIMHTSGSTGRPKGVVIPHRGVVRLVVGADYARFDPPRRWALTSSVAFDASTLEIWGPLLNGGTCVVQEAALPSLENLAEFFETRGITDAWLTSALFNSIVDERVRCLRGLSQLFVGGERESPPRMARFLDHCRDTRLIHGYGPTENTTFSLCHPITRADAASERVPIGRPIRGTMARIEQDDTGEAAPGQVGELLVGGDGLALGYLDDPSLTAQRFVSRDGSSWYRTGDLVRRRSDGAIEFLGRADRQVKIQGNRIELQEIEGAMAGFPGILDAAAIVEGESAESKRIVGCFTATPGLAVSPEALREHLLARLPRIMVPSSLHAVPQFPASLNGKVDFAALLAAARELERAGHARPNGSISEHAPATPQERALASIWARCLNLERIDRNATFLELGGHSLAAMRVAAAVRRETGVAIEPGDLLGRESLSVLAARLGAAEDAPATSGSPFGPMLSGIQRRLLRSCALEGSDEAYLVSTAFTLPASCLAETIEPAFGALVARHELLRTAVGGTPDDPAPVVLAELTSGWCVHHSRPVFGASPLPADVLQAAYSPLDLRRGPMRLDVWPLGAGGLLAVWTVHHAMIDEWSIRLCLEEVAEVLRGGEADQPTTRSGFARLEASANRHDLAAAQARAMAETLAASPLPFPEWRGEALEVECPIDAEVAEAVHATATRAGTTWVAPIALAYGMALQRLFGAAWRYATTPVAKRAHPDLIDVVDCCLETRVLECGLRPGEGIEDGLGRVYAELRRFQSLEFVPLETVVARLREHRSDLGEAPLQFALTARREPRPAFRVPGGSLRVLHVPQRRARFGVTLHAEEQDGRIHLRLEVSSGAERTGVSGALVGAIREALGQVTGAAAPTRVAEPTSRDVGPADSLPRVEVLDEIRRRIVADAWLGVLGQPATDDSTNLFACGGSSLGVLRLVAAIRRATGVAVDAGRLMESPTFGSICGLVAAGRSESPRPWISVGADGNPEAIVVIPGSGGEAVGLWPLARLIVESTSTPLRVVVIDLAEILRAGPEPSDPSAVLRSILDSIERCGCGRIKGILGYSLGGLFAIEAANALARAGAPIDRLWLLDAYESRLMRRDPHLRAGRKILSVARRALSRAPVAAPPDRVSEPGTAARGQRRSGEKARQTDWKALAHRLGRWPIGPCDVPALLLRSTQTAREVGVLRGAGTNGFSPAKFRRLDLEDLEITHLGLIKSGAPLVARIIAQDIARMREERTR